MSTDVHKGDGGCEAESALSVSYATNAGTLDTIDSLSFLRSDTNDIMNGELRMRANLAIGGANVITTEASMTDITIAPHYDEWNDPGDIILKADVDVNGDLVASGSVTAASFLYSSDIRLKKNITVINNSLDKIKQLEGVSFEWKDEERGSGTNLGLIAQDVEKVFPELVGISISENGTEFKNIQYGNLVSPLIESVKELDKEDERLNNKSEEQDKEIAELRNEIELLRAEISALSSGNLATNLTLRNININSTLENQDTNLIFGDEETNPPLKNKSFFSKYFYTLFSNKF